MVNELGIQTNHYTNNIAESQFKTLKHSICSGRLKMSMTELVDSLTIKTQNFYENKSLDRRFEKSWEAIKFAPSHGGEEEEEEEEEEEHKIMHIDDQHIRVDDFVVNVVDLTCTCDHEDCHHIITLIERFESFPSSQFFVLLRNHIVDEVPATPICSSKHLVRYEKVRVILINDFEFVDPP